MSSVLDKAKKEDDVLRLIQREGTLNGPTAAEITEYLDRKGISREDVQAALQGDRKHLSEMVNTGTANTVGRTQADEDRDAEAAQKSRDKQERELKKTKRQAAGPTEDDDDDSEPVIEVGHYNDDGVNNDDRRAELSRRGLSIEGNKRELIERLEADDAEDDDAEDED